jgi:UDP-N-acetylmuramate--alanine ligase
MGSNARLGKSQYLVAEADESDRSFLKLSPILAVITNIDREHMDCYRNMRDVRQTFLEFMDRVPFYGMIVACNDDPILRKLLPQAQRRVITYGIRRGSDFLIKPGDIEQQPGEHRPLSHFQVSYRGKPLDNFLLHVPGTHNILNATAAIAVGIGLDLPVEKIRTALENFRGVDRRFQLKGRVGEISIVDDYGHHPTEIKATLAAAKQCGFRKIRVIFQPHRYSRTKALMDDFAEAFRDADTLYVLDIYAASEKPIEGVTGESLAARIREATGQNVTHVPSFGVVADQVSSEAEPGDLILTLGAGSVSQLGPTILEKLQLRVEGVAAKA